MRDWIAEVFRDLRKWFGPSGPLPPEVRVGRDGLSEAALHRNPFLFGVDAEMESEEFLRRRFEKLTGLEGKAREMGLRFAHAERLDPEQEALQAVPEELARKHCCLPYVVFKGSLCLVMSEPNNLAAIDEVGTRSGYRIVPVLGDRREILRAVKRAYADHTTWSMDKIG